MTELLDKLAKDPLLRREMAGRLKALCAEKGVHPGVFQRRLNERILFFEGREDVLYRCCLVSIPGFSKGYAYLTEDLTLSRGEQVLVPFGGRNSTQMGIVMKAFDCTEDIAPYPVTEMKKIICRVSDPADTK